MIIGSTDAVRYVSCRNQSKDRGYEVSKERTGHTDARKEKDEERVRIDVNAARCRLEKGRD